MSIITIAHLFLRFCNQRSMVKTNALGNTSHIIIFWANLSILLLHKRLCNNGFHNGIFPMCSFLHSISVRGPRFIFVSSSSSSSWYFEAQFKREVSSFVAHRIDRMRRTFGWYFCCCVFLLLLVFCCSARTVGNGEGSSTRACHGSCRCVNFSFFIVDRPRFLYFLFVFRIRILCFPFCIVLGKESDCDQIATSCFFFPSSSSLLRLIS